MSTTCWENPTCEGYGLTNPVHIYELPGVYTVRVTVSWTDGYGVTHLDSDTASVVVGESSAVLNCDVGGPYEGVVGYPITVQAVASFATPPNNPPARYVYTWIWGDNSPSTSIEDDNIAEHVYRCIDTYTITMIVKAYDENSLLLAECSDAATVYVERSSESLPSRVLGGDNSLIKVLRRGL